MEITLAQLAVRLNGALIGGDADSPVTGISGLDSVREGEVTYVRSERYLAEAEASPALAIIAPTSVPHGEKPMIHVADVASAYTTALRLFDWRKPPMPGIDPSAVLAQSASVHAYAHVGAFVSVGEFAYIANGCIIYPHVVIGDQVEIGEGTIIYPNVTIYPRCTIGKNVIIHAGTVIGADGHGYTPRPEGWEKIPQLGTVLVEDDVELGANVTVDRATTGQTVIGRGSKIDNLVHIAHNVKIGPRCMIVAQVGIAGSTTLDEWVVMGGQAGVKDHAHIGAGAQIAARAGITSDVPPGVTFYGFPARDRKEQLRVEAGMRRLPDLLKQMRELERRLAEVEGRQAEKPGEPES